MTQKIVIVVVGDRNRPELVARTYAALDRQSVPCEKLVVWIGSFDSPPAPLLEGGICLPHDLRDSRAAGGFGMQLALNEQADLVTTIHAGDELDRRSIEFVAAEIARSGAEIVEVREPFQTSAMGTFFITARAAYCAAIWAQIPDRMSCYFRDVVDYLAAQQGVKLSILYFPILLRRENIPPVKTLRASKSDIVRSLYERTGITLCTVIPTSITKIKSVAVITPYYKEPTAKLRRCHESVLRQGPNVRHYMVADGHPNPELDRWKITHVALPRGHSDNGNTPRGLGSMLAFAQGFDAIAFLDADNWYADFHIRSMIRCQERSGARIVCAWRTIVLPDGIMVPKLDPEDARKSHVDTSCFLITKNVGFLGAFWAQMPQTLGPVCDRVFLAYARVVDPKLAWTDKQTVFFESNYRLHFRIAGRPVPGEVHDIKSDLWGKIDLVQFKHRTGHDLAVKRQIPAKKKRAPPQDMQALRIRHGD